MRLILFKNNNEKKNYILIVSDKSENNLNVKYLPSTLPPSYLHTFNELQKSLKYIKSKYFIIKVYTYTECVCVLKKGI